jgi:threonine aldolase
MRSFGSDNNAGLCPEALQAMINANAGGHQVAYGDDEFTADAVVAFREVFGEETAVFFTATGSAANILAIASLAAPWSAVICHGHSHYNVDESTAPERITHCRAVPIHPASGAKLSVEDVQRAMSGWRGDVHQPQPGVVTLTNASEFGAVYAPGEIRGIAEAAHRAGWRVHIDGARFANAVAALGCNPRDLSSRAGVDALSFGGTKNALAYGEAVLFFPQDDRAAFARAVHDFPYQRKSTGHLLSKHRFVAAPFAATLRDGSWLRHARHANAMAKRLADGLTQLGLTLRFPCEANAVFVNLPAAADERLRAAGHSYYPFGEPEWGMVRLMCSFDTQPADIESFLRDARAVLGR